MRVGSPFHARGTPDAFCGETKGRDPHSEIGQAGGRPVGPRVDGHNRKQTLHVPYPSGPDARSARTRLLSTWLSELCASALGVVLERPPGKPRLLVRSYDLQSCHCFEDPVGLPRPRIRRGERARGRRIR